MKETIPFRGQTERLLKRGPISGGSFKESSCHCHLHQAACLPPEWNGLLYERIATFSHETFVILNLLENLYFCIMRARTR